jgi:hypothetical protein
LSPVPDVAGVSPVPAPKWAGVCPVADVAGVGPVPVPIWAGVEPSPGADVGKGKTSPSADVGRGETSPSADVAGVCPVLVQMWRGVPS